MVNKKIVLEGVHCSCGGVPGKVAEVADEELMIELPLSNARRGLAANCGTHG